MIMQPSLNAAARKLLTPINCHWLVMHSVRPAVWQVGLLDIDICGPSIPKMLGLEGEEIHQSNAGWSPVYVEDNLGVMSIGEHGW